MKFKKGDKVRLISGRDRGREGVIEKIYAQRNVVLIANVNMYKKHIKKSEQAPKGGIVEVPRPISVSKVALVCPKCSQQTRVGFIVENEKKNRICKKCKEKL